MALVFEVYYLNLIRSCWVTRASSLSVITIVGEKDSFSRGQAYIKKWSGPGNEADIHQNKKIPDRPILLANLGPGGGKRTIFKVQP